MKLSEWDRQNNFCIYTGSGFIKIPIPHELRVFHRVGDIAYQAIYGYTPVDQALIKSVTAFSDLIPIDPMGAADGSSRVNHTPRLRLKPPEHS